jgi:uncharacterized protein YggE
MTENTITVTARARRTVAPDVVEWRLTVEVVDPEPRVAYDRCAERASGIVERLRDAQAEVETERISVEPHHVFDTETPHQAGHEATSVVLARGPVERAGEIADVAMAAGADQVHGPKFAIRDSAAIVLDALDDAVADARRRAERLAAGSGRALGAIRSIDARDEDQEFGFELMSTDGMPVEPSDRAVTANVTVVFALED